MSNRRSGRSGRGRYRRMYELTGLPGWVRYGSSPGFAGGGRGMGPCAEYLQRTGQLEEFLEEYTSNNPNAKLWPYPMIPNEKPSSKEEKELLEKRIKALEEELNALKKQLKKFR